MPSYPLICSSFIEISRLYIQLAPILSNNTDRYQVYGFPIVNKFRVYEIFHAHLAFVRITSATSCCCLCNSLRLSSHTLHICCMVSAESTCWMNSPLPSDMVSVALSSAI